MPAAAPDVCGGRISTIPSRTCGMRAKRGGNKHHKIDDRIVQHKTTRAQNCGDLKGKDPKRKAFRLDTHKRNSELITASTAAKIATTM